MVGRFRRMTAMGRGPHLGVGRALHTVGRFNDPVGRVAGLPQQGGTTVERSAVDRDFQWHVVSPKSIVEATGMITCPFVRSALKPDGGLGRQWATTGRRPFPADRQSM